MTRDRPRPIDRLRDGAVSMEIRTPEDDSEVRGFMNTADRLLVVKGAGIYEVRLADQIDPERTNVATPNTVQRVLEYGADTPWVGAVVLTAHHFLVGPCPLASADGASAFDRVLGLAEDLAGAHKVAESLVEAEANASKTYYTGIREDRSFVMPSVESLEPRCNEFLQRADHALKELFKIVQEFYSDVGSGGWDGLHAKLATDPENGDNFEQFVSEVLPFLRLIRGARNCVEHPRPEQRMVVTNYSLDAANQLLPPMIEVLHPQSPLEATAVSDFFDACLQNLTFITEQMVVFLCSRAAQSVGGFPVYVIEIPEGRRKYLHVRYGWGAELDGRIVQVG